MKLLPPTLPFGPNASSLGSPFEEVTCHEWIKKGAPGHKRIRIRIAGDLADGVVQLARLVARGFGMQGWPVELLVHPSTWIRAEPGSPGAHIMTDISALVPTETTLRESTNNPDGAPAEDQIDGWVVFRSTSLPRAMARPKPDSWVLVDADALSARQLAMPQELPWDAAAMAVDIHALSFLSLPRELDLDRHWRRTQRLLSPREMARCRAFTPLGWIAGRYGLDVGPWDIWIEDHFRNHPPMRDMAQSLLRAGHHAALVSDANQTDAGTSTLWPGPTLMRRGLWRLATGFEALVTGLANATTAQNRKIYIFAPQSPTYAPLLAMAPNLEFRGILIRASESPQSAAWNAWGAWLGGASALALGAGDHRSQLPKISPFRPGGTLIFLDPEPKGAHRPEGLFPETNRSVISSPGALAKIAESWAIPDTMNTILHVPNLWHMEEPVHMESVGPKSTNQTSPNPFPPHFSAPLFPSQPTETISPPRESEPGLEHRRPIQQPNHIPPRPTTPEKGWCPGCGNYSILEHLTPFLVNGSPVVVLGAPGCAGLLGDWLPIPHTICPTGTVIHVAIGLHLAWPEAATWIIAGDGELGGASLGPMLGMARENVSIKVVFVNNECAAGAGGAVTPLSGQLDYRNPGTPPLPLAALILMAGVGFYARVIDVEVDLLDNTMAAATRHQGCAVIEVWQNCRVHNDANHDDLIDRQLGKRHRLDLRPGRPMTYDSDPERGILWAEDRLTTQSMNATALGRFLVHDPMNTPVNLGVALVEMGLGNPGEPTCFGIFLDRTTPPRISRLAMSGAVNALGSGKSDAWILPDYSEISENQSDDPNPDEPNHPEPGE